MRLRRLSSAGLAAALLALVLAVPGTAASAKTLVSLSGIATPPIDVFTLTPRTLSLTIDARFATDAPGELPATISKAVVYFPHGPRVNGALFPACDPAKLRRARGAARACPAGSRLGGGTALGTSPQFAGVIEHLKVEIYSGRGGRSLIFYLHGENPVLIGGMIVAPFVALHGGRWGYRLTMPVPQDLQEIASGIFASLLDFKVTTGGSVRVHGRRHGFIEALACPPGALVPVQGTFDFLDHEAVTSSGYVTCR